MENYKEKAAAAADEDEETIKIVEAVLMEAEDLGEEDVSAVAARIQEEQEVLREFGY